MTTQHTPTPWGYEYNDEGDYDNHPFVIMKGSMDDGITVAMVQAFSCDDEEDNAAFIVRACNGWNDKEALRTRLAELEAQDASL